MRLTHVDNTEDTQAGLAKQQKIRKKTVANRARHRLMSIRSDIEHFCQPTLQQPHLRGFPVVANERCGSWYAYPLMSKRPNSCYFKSTDGHVGTWNFSLKRLNLNIVSLVAQHHGCVILDASASKELPDSFSRTIPIWAAVLNRITARFRQELGMPPFHDEWDGDVYTPSFVVSLEEHDVIKNLIDSRVEALYQSQAIVNPSWLVSTLVKPLRPYWITPRHGDAPTTFSSDFYSIVCVNCSECQPKSARKEKSAYLYTAGSADDHESWARYLNPRLFWDNIEAILDEPDTEDATDIAIDAIVQRELAENDAFERNADTYQERPFDAIGSTNVFVGTRRAGRPPECWEHFDAILNVTDMEYPDIMNSCRQNSQGNGSIKRSDEVNSLPNNSFFYLQLPVSEGKRDKNELERWMAVGVFFVLMHAKLNRKVLIHCAQGKDRSVAIAMAVVAIFCDLKFPLQWNERFSRLAFGHLLQQKDNDESYLVSGLPRRLVQSMLGREGRDRLFAWVREMRCERPDDPPLATKETLRVALLLIQQDREKADPSRSTMQKLNRFFMSTGTYSTTLTR